MLLDYMLCLIHKISDRLNLVQMIHNDIKRQDGSSLENHLSRQLRDHEASRLLYQSLDNYNAFALQFYCDLLPPARTRVKRDLSLHDGTTLDRKWFVEGKRM